MESAQNVLNFLFTHSMFVYPPSYFYGGELMKRINHGNEKMPDFDQLTDRIIANASNLPKIEVKTNLDTKDVTDKNPYQKEKMKDKNKFNQFFNK